MNKLHGVYGIKPLTLADISVADDANIAEHKLALRYNTDVLNTDIVDLRADFTAHTSDNSDPHGAVLYQSTLRTNALETPVSSTPTNLTVRNSGAGYLTVKVIGDVEAVNERLSGTLNVAGASTFGGDVTVNGRFTVNGGYDISNATVVDYDMMQITPTTKTNPTGLVIAPDDEGQMAGVYTYTGDLIQAYKRVGSVNSIAFRVDSAGNIYSAGNRFDLGNCSYINDGSKVVASLPQTAPQYVSYAQNGFKYVAASNTPVTDNTFVAYKADGATPTFYANKNGDLYTATRLKIGNSSWFTWNESNGSLEHSTSIRTTNAPQYLKDSPLYIQATNKTDWKVTNRDSSVAFTYGSNSTPTVEFTQNSINAPTCTIYAKGIETSGPIVIPPGQFVDGVDVGEHNHSGAVGMGPRIPATSVIGLQEFLNAHTETVQDIVGGMVSGGVENGISITYDDANGKLGFDVSDFSITLSGDATGTATVSNLNSVTLTVSVLDNSHNHTNLTGTTSSTFWLDSDANGPKLKNSAGVFEVRNAADTEYADLRVNNLFIEGGSTIIKSEVVTVADNIVRLNSNYVGSAPTENAGLEVNRGTLPVAQILWEESSDRWSCGISGSMSPIVTEASLTNPTNVETVQDIVGGMVSGNTENGIAVTYNDSTNKLDFDVNDFTITLSGDVSGTVTVTNLTSTTAAITVLDDSHNHTNLTGTTSTTFWIDSDANGPKIKNNSGVLEARNYSDSSYADIRVGNLNVEGATTNIKSETVTIAANTVKLNTSYSGSAPTENAGIEVNRGTLSTAQILWDEAADRWSVGMSGALSPIVTESTINNPTNTELIQDIVGEMVSGNTENGVAVTYNDSTGKLDFDVNDFTVTLSGNASGSATITNLGSVTLSVTVLDSAKVGGLSIHAARNNEVNKIVRTDANGYLQTGWINTTSGDAGTSVLDRVYASYDGYVRYYTPTNFANQILALGSVKNAHTHTGASITTSVATAANDLLVGQLLRWKNYGNGHVIFDASAGTSPTGSAVNKTNPTYNWSAGYPTLMGWNGTATYGVRVDSSKNADYAANAATVDGISLQKGSSTFNSTTGRSIVISTMPNTSYAVSITATGNTGGNLGDVYVSGKTTTGFTVYNTGSFTGSFDWIVTG